MPSGTNTSLLQTSINYDRKSFITIAFDKGLVSRQILTNLTSNFRWTKSFKIVDFWEPSLLKNLTQKQQSSVLCFHRYVTTAMAYSNYFSMITATNL